MEFSVSPARCRYLEGSPWRHGEHFRPRLQTKPNLRRLRVFQTERNGRFLRWFFARHPIGPLFRAAWHQMVWSTRTTHHLIVAARRYLASESPPAIGVHRPAQTRIAATGARRRNTLSPGFLPYTTCAMCPSMESRASPGSPSLASMALPNSAVPPLLSNTQI